jgi:hypothetical protein
MMSQVLGDFGGGRNLKYWVIYLDLGCWNDTSKYPRTCFTLSVIYFSQCTQLTFLSILFWVLFRVKWLKTPAGSTSAIYSSTRDFWSFKFSNCTTYSLPTSQSQKICREIYFPFIRMRLILRPSNYLRLLGGS